MNGNLEWYVTEVKRLQVELERAKEDRNRIGIQIRRQFWKLLDELRQENNRLRESNQELEDIFSLQQGRLAEATAAWQHATGKTDTLPDLGDVLSWMLAENRRLKQATA